MKINTRYFIFCLFMLATSPAHAGVGCQGNVLSVEVRPSGEVAADHGFGTRLICNLTANTATCQAIASQFLTAFASGKKIISHHATANTCAEAFAPGTWQPADPPFAYTVIP